MDFYGVSDGYVLGIIDLDSLYVELAFHDDRTAEGVERTVRDRILFRHGVPDQLHSDHAAEFVGRVMKSLASKYGYMPTTTGGYCPTGNSTIESFWAYLGICIRNLSDDDYNNIEDHLQRMAFAWNSTISESLSVSPFEVMTGTQARSIPDSAMRTEPGPSGLDADAIRAIKDAVAEYTLVARRHADYMRRKRADHKDLAVGQQFNELDNNEQEVAAQSTP